MIRTALIAAATALLALAPAHAADAGEAEAFVERNARDIIETLQDLQAGERSVDEVKAEFRDRIHELAAVERITNFVLGRYRRTADEDTLDRFRTVFEEFAINVYENELSNYAGQTLDVTGSITRDSDDWIVRSQVTGGPDGRAWEVNWRVLETDGALQVLDAQVAGVWLAQTQRDQITSLIGDAGGNVQAATDQLCTRIREQDESDWERVCAGE